MFKKTVIITILNLLTTILNFCWSLVLAYQFGASGSMDAYLVVINFINLFSTIFLKFQNNALIPFLFDFKSEDKKREVIAEISRLSLLLFSLLSLNVYFFAGQIIELLAPGLSADNTELATTMLKVISPAILLYSFIGLNNGLLDQSFRFPLTGTVNLTRAVFSLLFLLALSQYIDILSIPVSQVSALTLTFVLSFVLFKKYGFHIKRRLTVDWVVIKDYALIASPLLLCYGISEIINLTKIFIGSYLNEGSISYLIYSDNLLVFISILSASVLTTTFSALSKHNSPDENTEYLKIFYKGFETLVYILTPLAVFIFINSESIITVLYKRGVFSSTDVLIVSDTIKCYIYVLVGGPLGTFLVYAYYSRKKYIQTILPSAVSVAVNVLTSIVLSRHFSHYGIAFALSISIFMGNVLFLYGLKKIINGLDFGFIWKRTAKIFLSAGITGCILYSLKIITTFRLFDNDLIHHISILVFFSFLAGASYLVISFFLKIDIQRIFFSEILKLFSRKMD